ncbi:pH-responsive protein 2 [[Candida] jaroonii]|uniref:PH-responsive protein 2 n=1 Tax=[Candida] jaroonii TaxID=467808 RepID=A0ACA9YBM1_9ASCO|nr:pH-responsive protein 2 [[Candida] jaroonii]
MIKCLILLIICAVYVRATTLPMEVGHDNVKAIKIQGNKFVTSEGYQFYIKGIAYQRNREEHDSFVNDGFGYIDPLANKTTCLRDLKYLQQLNVNVVRVYQIDPSKNHDICMDAFASKGIYVLLDLAEPETSINRNNPTWNIDVFDRYKYVIDSMHKYNNVLGFFAGNEVSNSLVNIDASPFVKAAIRDSKSYMKSKGYRNIPVGYASNDDSDIRNNVADYFSCGDSSERADFFGLNMYEWCGYSSYSTSGYRDRTFEFGKSTIPVFFSEFGCNTMTPRPFTEVEALYGLTMSKVWSGGIAYEYFQHGNKYGVVKETKNGSIVPLDDFNILSSRYNLNTPKQTSIVMAETNETNLQQCPQSSDWKASEKLPPTPDRGKCECLQSSLSCILTPFKEVREEDLLNEVCSKIDCKEIAADGIHGQYGKFSDCSLNQKVSFALDKYYSLHNKTGDACNFNERAVLITNNDRSDLRSIFLRDGRTCEDALKDAESHDKEVQNSGQQKVSPTFDGYASFESQNKTEIAKSLAASYKNTISSLFGLGLLAILKYLF